MTFSSTGNPGQLITAHERTGASWRKFAPGTAYTTQTVRDRMTKQDQQSTPQQVADRLRACIEGQFPHLEVGVEPWDHGQRIRGHVADPTTGARLNFGHREKDAFRVNVISEDDLARLALGGIRDWLGKVRPTG